MPKCVCVCVNNALFCCYCSCILVFFSLEIRDAYSRV